MAAVWQRNEPEASKRRCRMRLWQPDGVSPLWRGTSFVGRQFFGQSSPSLLIATGTLENCRKRRTYTAFVFTANAGTDVCTKVAHGCETGDGASTVSNAGGGLPGGLAAATPYYFIRIDADTFKLATSALNAYLGVA